MSVSRVFFESLSPAELNRARFRVDAHLRRAHAVGDVGWVARLLAQRNEINEIRWERRPELVAS